MGPLQRNYLHLFSQQSAAGSNGGVAGLVAGGGGGGAAAVIPPSLNAAASQCGMPVQPAQPAQPAYSYDTERARRLEDALATPTDDDLEESCRSEGACVHVCLPNWQIRLQMMSYRLWR